MALSLLLRFVNGIRLVFPHHPLVPLDSLFPFPPPISSNASSLFAVLLNILINLHKPVTLALLVQSLVTPLPLPLSGLLVKRQVLALLSGLGLDTLLGSEPLPLRRRLGFGHWLLTRKPCRWRWQRQQDTVGCGFERAGAEKLVDQRLGAIAGDFSERLFNVGAVQCDGIGVLGEKVAQIKRIGRWLFNCDR